SVATGKRFPLGSAEDPDVGSYSVKTYSLSKNEHFSLKFKESKNSKAVPELVLEKPLDRERNSLHQLMLTALDGGNPATSGTCNIIIAVLDNNDNFPIFTENEYKISLKENSTEGSSIIKLTATDADEGLNGEVMYLFGSQTPENVLTKFKINEKTGEVILKGKLDYESCKSFLIDITAKDKGTPEMEGHCRVQLDVEDINDNAPKIVLTSKPSPVREDAPSGTVVALITARDLDSGENARVTLMIAKRYPFSLKPSFSNNYELITSGVLDREKISEYNIEVTATDSGSPPLSSRKIIPVSITDVNDNPPVFTQASYNVYLKENGLPGSILYSVSASDLDFGENAKISYSILDSKVTAVDADSGHNAWVSYRLAEATDASLFTVNQYTGEVRTKRAVSEQDDSSQRLLIEIRDDGEPTQSSTVTLSVLLEDGLHEPILDLRQKIAEPSQKSGRITLYLIVSLASVSVLSLLTFLVLAKPNRNLQIQLNTDGPIKYVEVLGGDVMSQSQSFRSCMSPMSEYSDFTLIKPSSTTDFKEVISVLDASLPDSTWTFESQQVRGRICSL
ncbi:unnamed protein product, partial [Tetraodon nigroviridis]